MMIKDIVVMPKCSNCGKYLKGDEKFCPYCSTKTNFAKKYKIQCITSLVLWIIFSFSIDMDFSQIIFTGWLGLFMDILSLLSFYCFLPYSLVLVISILLKDKKNIFAIILFIIYTILIMITIVYFLHDISTCQG